MLFYFSTISLFYFSTLKHTSSIADKIRSKHWR